MWRSSLKNDADDQIHRLALDYKFLDHAHGDLQLDAISSLTAGKCKVPLLFKKSLVLAFNPQRYSGISRCP